MDIIDKKLLLALDKDCFLTYSELSRITGLTANDEIVEGLTNT